MCNMYGKGIQASTVDGPDKQCNPVQPDFNCTLRQAGPMQQNRVRDHFRCQQCSGRQLSGTCQAPFGKLSKRCAIDNNARAMRCYDEHRRTTWAGCRALMKPSVCA